MNPQTEHRLRREDPGRDLVVEKDATMTHRVEMLALCSDELTRADLSPAERTHLAAMRTYWQKSVDDRLAQLANGTRPEPRRVLRDPPGHPSILRGIAETCQLWSPVSHAVAA